MIGIIAHVGICLRIQQRVYVIRRIGEDVRRGRLLR